MAKSRKKSKPPRKPIKALFIFALGLFIGGGGMWWYKAEPQERERAITAASNYWGVAETKAVQWVEDIRERLNSTNEPVNEPSPETATRGRGHRSSESGG